MTVDITVIVGIRAWNADWLMNIVEVTFGVGDIVAVVIMVVCIGSGRS